jgi:hypothetical protein
MIFGIYKLKIYAFLVKIEVYSIKKLLFHHEKGIYINNRGKNKIF